MMVPSARDKTDMIALVVITGEHSNFLMLVIVRLCGTCNRTER